MSPQNSMIHLDLSLLFSCLSSLLCADEDSLEFRYVHRAMKTWSKNPNIIVLGNTNVPRLAILSMIIRCGVTFLHYDFVVALLNDLFGIQARGGCACAAPYVGFTTIFFSLSLLTLS
jgi:selenocysteine lyase/cysteine desulfurase